MATSNKKTKKTKSKGNIDVKISKSKTTSKKAVKGPQIADISQEGSLSSSDSISSVVSFNKKSENPDQRKYKLIGLLSLIFATVYLISFSLAIFWEDLFGKNIYYDLPEEVSAAAVVDVTNLYDSKKSFVSHDSFSHSKKILDSTLDSLSSSLGFTYSTDLKQYLEGKLVLGSIHHNSNDSLFAFLGTPGGKYAKEILKTASGDQEYNDFGNYRIYTLSTTDNNLSFYATAKDKYIVISNDLDTHKYLLTFPDEKSLGKNKYFQDLSSNISKSSLVDLYLKPQELPKVISILNDSWRELPFNYIFSNSSNILISFAPDETGLHTSVYSDNENSINSNVSLSEEVTQFIPKKVVTAYSGVDALSSFQKMDTYLRANNPSFSEKIIELSRTLNDTYSLSLEKDVLTLIEDEFSFIIFPKTNENNLGLVIKSTSNAKLEQKLPKIEDAFNYYYAKDKPLEKEFSLFDGSVATELLPNFESYKFSDVEFDNHSMRTIADHPDTMSYSIAGDYLVIGSTRDTLESMLAAASGNNLLSDKKFISIRKKLDSPDDSLLYMDISNLIDYLNIDINISEHLENFSSFYAVSENNKKLKLEGYLLIDD